MKFIKEKNNRFHIVSRSYELYGNLGEKYSYIHFEDRSGTTYCVWTFPTADIMRLVHGKMSWKQFASAVYDEYYREEEEDRRWREAGEEEDRAMRGGLIMKMLLLEAVPDVERRTVVITTREVAFPDTMSSRERLEEYYRLLDCRCIDIREVAINGKYFDLIVDDEGLLKDRLIPTFYVEEDDTALFGNILFAHCDEEGETVGLEDSELPMLADYIGENLKSLKNFFARLPKV